MPAPTNTSWATATDLGTTLPVTVTQTVDDAGTTYTVWYKYTAQATDVVIGIFGFGDLVTYAPTTNCWLTATTPYLSDLQIQSFTNRPIQIPVTSGTTYYFEFVPNAGNPSPAVLTLNVQAGPNETVPAGSIAVPDDFSGADTRLPLALLASTANQTVLRFVDNFPCSEAGDVLATSGRVLMLDNFQTLDLYVYDPTYQGIVATVDGAWLSGHDPVAALRACQGAQVWYVGNPGAGATHATVRRVSADGVYGGTTYGPFGAAGLAGIAAANDEAVLYYVNGTGTNVAVSKWDLNTNLSAGTLVAGVVGESVEDMLVTADDNIVVLYDAAGTRKLRIYDAAGVTVNTWSLGSGGTETQCRMAYAIDDPVSVWVWLHASTGVSTFKNIKLSDGTTITTVTTTEYELGAYQQSVTASPVRFGNSFSCPFWIVRAAIGPQPATQTYPLRRLRQFMLPYNNNLWAFIEKLEFICQAGVGLSAGPTGTPVQGEDPKIMVQISRDGGSTWGPELWLPLGKQGEYTRRAILRRGGRYRDGVVRVTVSDPVFATLLGCDGNIDPGIS